ncbi:MAG: hypothetical protein NVSMB30_05760 [Hymenobacter sp.]
MLLGSFVPQNDLSELAKLPQLVEHYRFHHSAAGGGLSLAEFLVEHYGTGTKQHFGCTFSARHQNDHQGLPLHGRHVGGGGVSFIAPGGRVVLPQCSLVVMNRQAWQSALAARYQGGPGAVLLPPPRA